MQSCHFLWLLFPTCACSLHQFPKWLFFMSILIWKNLLLNPTPVFNCTRWWILL
jgi:hypothetical protein